MKALVGQAFQEPNNRLLYGGWDGSGSDPSLRPERSTTFEVSTTYTARDVSHLLSLYRVRNHDTFVNTVHTATNLGTREVIGFDYHVQARWSGAGHRQLKAWGYYSRLARTVENKLDENGNETGSGPIGDLSGNKFHAGLTGILTPHITMSISARAIGARRTVSTNPVGSVRGYATIDAFLRADDIRSTGVGISIRVTNAANTVYFHPGVRDANAGTTPGFFDQGGLWHGSGGYFNSILPQPGRTVVLALHFDLPRRGSAGATP